MEKYDHLEFRCPRLGGEVKFSYCKNEGGDLPCLRIVNCWQDFLPVEGYLRDRLTPDEWERFPLQVPKDKISTLIELIEEAKARAKLNNRG